MKTDEISMQLPICRKNLLKVFFQADVTLHESTTAPANKLRHAAKHTLSFAPWPSYPYHPAVQFSLMYDNTNLYLQYTVEEKHLQAAHGHLNGPVYRDSCVEFFIAFGNESYYNFEFNCVGNMLAAYGAGRNNRRSLGEEYLHKINTQSIIRKAACADDYQWELTIIMPLETFCFDQLSTLKGKQCTANFYKCGDELPEPHYLSWSNIESPEPNFHLPEFFGELEFV